VPAERRLDRRGRCGFGQRECGVGDRRTGCIGKLRLGLFTDVDVCGSEPGRLGRRGEALAAFDSSGDRVCFGGIGDDDLEQGAGFGPGIGRGIGVVIFADVGVGHCNPRAEARTVDQRITESTSLGEGEGGGVRGVKSREGGGCRRGWSGHRGSRYDCHRASARLEQERRVRLGHAAGYLGGGDDGGDELFTDKIIP